MKNNQKGAIINSLGNLKSKVVTANEIPVPEKKLPSKNILLPEIYELYKDKNRDELIEIINRNNKWIDKITDYCGQQGILPEDLIAFHAEGTKRAAMKPKGIKELKIKEDNPSKSNFRANLVKNKTGYSPTD